MLCVPPTSAIPLTSLSRYIAQLRHGDADGGPSGNIEEEDDNENSMELSSALTVQTKCADAKSTSAATRNGLMPPPSTNKLTTIDETPFERGECTSGASSASTCSDSRKRRENPVRVEADESSQGDDSKLGGPMEVASTVVSCRGGQQSTPPEVNEISPRKKVRATRGGNDAAVAAAEDKTGGGRRRLRSTVDVSSTAMEAVVVPSRPTRRR